MYSPADHKLCYYTCRLLIASVWLVSNLKNSFPFFVTPLIDYPAAKKIENLAAVPEITTLEISLG